MSQRISNYTLLVGCHNCGRYGKVRIARTYELSKARCPECGTRQLQRVAWIWPWQRRFDRKRDYASVS